MSGTAADPVPGQGLRPWLALAVLTLPSVVTSIDSTVLQLATPHLSASLRPSGTQLLWIFDVYGLVTTCLLIPFGGVADRVGRRRMLFGGAAVFGIASALAALSTSPAMLIAARALMGAAAAAVMPATLALITVVFTDADRRARAISIWLGCSMLGMIAGPVVGGVLLEFFWWGSVFLLGIPVTVLLLVAGPALLPPAPRAATGRIDVPGAVLAAAGVLAVVYGVQGLAAESASWALLAVSAAGVGLLALFCARQLRIPEPLLDVRLFRRPAFGLAALVMTVGAVVIGGGNFFVGQYLQAVLSLSPFEAGLALTPAAVASIAGFLVSPPLQRRLPAGRVAAGGLLLGAAGVALFVLASTDGGPWPVILGGVVMSLGLGATIALCSNAILGAAPPERAGQASAVQELTSQGGVVLGVALLGAAGTLLYRLRLDDRLEGVTVPVPADERSTIAAAVAAGRRLGGPGRDLVLAAQSSFVDAFRLSAVVSAVALLVVAVIATRIPERITAEEQDDQPEMAKSSGSSPSREKG